MVHSNEILKIKKGLFSGDVDEEEVQQQLNRDISRLPTQDSDEMDKLKQLGESYDESHPKQHHATMGPEPPPQPLLNPKPPPQRTAHHERPLPLQTRHEQQQEYDYEQPDSREHNDERYDNRENNDYRHERRENGDDRHSDHERIYDDPEDRYQHEGHDHNEDYHDDNDRSDDESDSHHFNDNGKFLLNINKAYTASKNRVHYSEQLTSLNTKEQGHLSGHYTPFMYNESYSKPCQISKIQRFAKIFNGR